jgi:hypothetical protein
LNPDPHSVRGTYQTTTLYLDTPFFDVYHKSPGYRRSKYRVRRYGSGKMVFLERKRRKGDRVCKRREVLPLADLTRLLDPDSRTMWFSPCVQERLLRPVCAVAYARTALVGTTLGGPVRLTLDRGLVGSAASEWAVPARVEGRELLAGEAILELKFQVALPGLFHDLLCMLPALSPGGSKYGRCVRAWDLVQEGGSCLTG